MDAWAYAEMAGASFKDARRRKSMAVVLTNLVKKPGESFSAAAGSAKRQAAHRLFSDENVGVDDLLAGHFEQTLVRIEQECRGGLVLVVQDTSEYDFTKLKATTGLGYVNDSNARGLFGHSALALTPAGLPLGVMDLDLWVRDDAEYGKGSDRRNLDITQKESYRWISTLKTVEEQMPVGQHVLFVQDREADIFAFLEAPTRSTTYVLVRANQPRRVEVLGGSDEAKPHKRLLFDAACEAPATGRMQVTIPRGDHRPGRSAELIVQSTAIRIMPPKGRKGVGTKPVSAWVVRASELDPPDGAAAVAWVLVTTLPIRDEESACQLVEYYSRRWAIERLHYTIKSGCKAEQLQMDDVKSIKLALALYYVTAWRFMYITYVARVQPAAPAALILRPSEIEILQLIEKKPINTTSAAVISIAKLGGHTPYKNAAPPGVKVLWIGLRRLEDMEAGWLLAREHLNRPA